jgi:hypothetical protein
MRALGAPFAPPIWAYAKSIMNPPEKEASDNF